MKLNTIFGVVGIVLSGVACVATVAQAADSIKNGNKRAAIIGDAAGRAAVDEHERRHPKKIK